MALLAEFDFTKTVPGAPTNKILTPPPPTSTGAAPTKAPDPPPKGPDKPPPTGEKKWDG